MTFDIGPDSSITDIPRQLTRTDFSRILGEGELSLQRATGTWYDAGSPNVPGVMAFAITSDGLGGYYVATKEDATGLGGDLGDQHPGTSEEVRLALRIAGAAAEDLDTTQYGILRTCKDISQRPKSNHPHFWDDFIIWEY